MRRLLALAWVLASCAANVTLPSPSPSTVPPSSTPRADLGAYFDKPPEFPGYQWTYRGRLVDTRLEMNTIAAAGHCGWEAATLMHLPSPPGTTSASAADMTQYVRDARRVTPQGHLHGLLDLRASLPSDAVASGYHFQTIDVYLSPSDKDSVYVVGPNAVERWPRAEPKTLCS